MVDPVYIFRFENRGFKLIAMKMTMASESVVKKHYNDVSDKPFFPRFVKYMTSSPVVAMIWEGLNVASICRDMIGTNKPETSAPGTIRADNAIYPGMVLCWVDIDLSTSQVQNFWPS